MKWQEIAATTVTCAVEAVANLFYEAGMHGVVIEERGAGEVTLRGYLAEGFHPSFSVEALTKRLEELGAYFPGFYVHVETRWLVEEDWANAWKAYFKPVKITDRLVVKPSWEEYTAGPQETVIELDPGMAFGTGTHPTTIMALKFIEEFVRPGFRVYDVGTGSGILAVAAALLGAREVIATDNDPVALRVARENVKRNGVDTRVRLAEGDLLAGFSDKADLIVANISFGVVLRLIPQAVPVLVTGGNLILGGILSAHQGEVLTALEGAGLCPVGSARQGDWVTLVARKG